MESSKHTLPIGPEALCEKEYDRSLKCIHFNTRSAKSKSVDLKLFFDRFLYFLRCHLAPRPGIPMMWTLLVFLVTIVFIVLRVEVGLCLY